MRPLSRDRNETLYFVRGSDPALRRFTYQVNPRFGNTAPQRSSAKATVVLNAIVRLDFGAMRERQMLLSQLDRGRKSDGVRLTEASLRATPGGGGVFNPLTAILRNADTLQLTPAQARPRAPCTRSHHRRV